MVKFSTATTASVQKPKFPTVKMAASVQEITNRLMRTTNVSANMKAK